jgi:hypothetical protein
MAAGILSGLKQNHGIQNNKAWHAGLFVLGFSSQSCDLFRFVNVVRRTHSLSLKHARISNAFVGICYC